MSNEIFQLQSQIMDLRNELKDMMEKVDAVEKWPEEFRIQNYLRPGYNIRFRDAPVPQAGRIGFAIDAIDGFPWGDLYSFGISRLASNQFRIYPGTLWIHGVGSYTTAQTDVTLSSSPDAYIYLSHAKDHTSTTIPSPAIATSPVAVAPSDYQFLLYKFSVVSGSQYRMSWAPYGGHDIHIGGILR